MRCERCAGLVVADHFIGGGTSIGGWAFGGWRCVNCGAIGLSGQAGAHLEVLQEAKKTVGKVVRQAQSFVGHEYQSDHRDGNDSNCRRPRQQGRS